MKQIKVLGTGCANCKTTMDLIRKVAADAGVEIELEKVEELQTIISYGVMSTPAVVVDGQVVHTGSVPSSNQIQTWF